MTHSCSRPIARVNRVFLDKPGWLVRDGARAKIRVMVKRILNRHGYPPDLQEVVKTMLQQVELLCGECV